MNFVAFKHDPELGDRRAAAEGGYIGPDTNNLRQIEGTRYYSCAHDVGPDSQHWARAQKRYEAMNGRARVALLRAFLIKFVGAAQ